ncbi:recombinase family protein [Rhodopseudomonas palustris]|uniref:recombinase family protein n=1 Tax=Rhodopseudomonas palustris TaxID=1076 RepID=UPI0021F399FB|nr:recombinase family protein [Rhodopseudomonas palustris]UYO54618.1 recombinase family protein [Rhodopseudomonas palustris]
MNKHIRSQIRAADGSMSGMRAALYLRVSTGRQAEHDLSIPDQRKQLVAWCGTKQWDVMAEFVEPGQSATDDKRPIFQQMIERACDGEHVFDVIIVHSYSRFFRDAFGQEFYLRKLAKAGVRLISITQPLGDDDDPAQAMMRKVIALFDEYQSKENGKHVLRSMKENARQGFWNGTTCPIGYKLVEVEKRGNRVKKKLDIDAVDSETVKLIFRLYLYGDGDSGALGVKEVVKWLNARGYRTPRGKTFSVGPVHKVLTNPVYIGSWRFNLKSSKTGERKPEDEIITIPVPAIIDPHTFEQVQRQLRARSPKVVAPRVTTGPILLTGLAVCATCGASMTLRTGTSSTGAVHRYYTCSACARSGKTACKGRSIRMDKLDRLVTEHLVERLFEPSRLTEMLSSLAGRRAEKEQSLNTRIAALQREVSDADEKLKRLYRLVEDGVTDLDEVLKDRLNGLKAERDRARAALERAKSYAGGAIQLDPALVEGFGRLMRQHLTTGSIPFRKAYLQSIIDSVEVDDAQIRIRGSKDVLEKAVLASRSGGLERSQMSTRWRTRHDSNV